MAGNRVAWCRRCPPVGAEVGMGRTVPRSKGIVVAHEQRREYVKISYYTKGRICVLWWHSFEDMGIRWKRHLKEVREGVESQHNAKRAAAIAAGGTGR